MKEQKREDPSDTADVEGQDDVRSFVQREARLHDPDIRAGDQDVDVYDAEFVGEEAVGGQNPTPDQSVVEDLGKATGISYRDGEWLHTTEKLEARDRTRWELEPESSEDYEERSDLSQP